MADYQLDAHIQRKIRVGQDEKVVATFHTGRWIQDQKGEADGEPTAMKLPAPWRGMRYRLLQSGREIASAGRPKYSREGAVYEIEMPGRKLELITEDRHHKSWKLLESGEECGQFTLRDFDHQGEWNADFSSREESAAFAGFVAWLTLEARGGIS